MDDSHEEKLLNETVTLEYTPAEHSGALKLTIRHGEKVVHSGVVNAVRDQGSHGQTQRGKFRNDAVGKAEDVEGLDSDDLGDAIDGWFGKFIDDADDADKDLRGDIANEVIRGTAEPVEIYGKPNGGTTYKVTLTFRGRTAEVDFNADVMVPGTGPGALQSALAHQFFEPVEVPKEDWEDIREYWADNSTVVEVRETDALDAKADRMVEFLSDSLNPVGSVEDLANGVTNAWVDAEYDRDPDVDGVDPDAVVWIQDRHFMDELDSITSIDDKGNLVDKLREREEMIDKWRTRRVTEGSTRDTIWGFDQAVFGVDPDGYDGDGGVEV